MKLGGTLMNRVSIIIHSINGNCFIIASNLKDILEKRNIDVRLYKVKDEDLHLAANKDEAANEYYEDIIDLPLVQIEKLLKSKMIIMGCPAIFSNITAEMTEFLDSTKELSEDGSLKGKYFTCFTSSQKGTVDGAGCIKALETWANAMQMNIVEEIPRIIHDSGPEGMVRPSINIANQLNKIADWIEANF